MILSIAFLPILLFVYMNYNYKSYIQRSFVSGHASLSLETLTKIVIFISQISDTCSIFHNMKHVIISSLLVCYNSPLVNKTGS